MAISPIIADYGYDAESRLTSVTQGGSTIATLCV